MITNLGKIVVWVPVAQLTEIIDEDHFKGEITFKIDPMIAKFNWEFEFGKRDSSPYKIAIVGKGAISMEKEEQP